MNCDGVLRVVIFNDLFNKSQNSNHKNVYGIIYLARPGPARPDRIKTNQTDSGHCPKSNSQEDSHIVPKKQGSIMATSSLSRVPAKPEATFSVVSTLKAYFIPFILFSASLLYQLIVIPRAFPRSHYDGESTLWLIHYNSVSQMYSTFFSFLELLAWFL